MNCILARSHFCYHMLQYQTLQYTTKLGSSIFLKISNRRYCNMRPFLPTPQNSKKITKLLKRDKIPDGYELVYQSPVANYIGLAHLTTLALTVSSLVLVTCSFPDYDTLSQQEDYHFGPQSSGEIIVAFGALIVACISMQVVSVKTPLRLYTNGKNFIMVRGHAILGPYGQGKNVEFRAGTAKSVKPSRLSMWSRARYNINNGTYFIYDNHFRTNADYLSMVGKNSNNSEL